MQDLTFESDFTPQDLKKAMLYNAFFRFKPTVPTLAVIFVVGILGILWVHELNVVGVLYLLCIAYPLYYVFSNLKQIRGAVQSKNTPKNVRQRIVLSEEQVLCARNGKFDHYDWGDVDSARESKECFYLYLQVGRVLVLPKRDVSADISYAARELLTAKLAPRRLRLRKDAL